MKLQDEIRENSIEFFKDQLLWHEIGDMHEPNCEFDLEDFYEKQAKNEKIQPVYAKLVAFLVIKSQVMKLAAEKSQDIYER